MIERGKRYNFVHSIPSTLAQGTYKTWFQSCCNQYINGDIMGT